RWARGVGIRCATGSSRPGVVRGATPPGRLRRGVPAIRRSSTPQPTRHARICTGRLVTSTSMRSSPRRGNGTAVIRRAMAPRQRTTLRRLFRYSLPYRGRMTWAIAGMILYAIGNAGLAFLVRPIFDRVLPNQDGVAVIAQAVIAVYLLKGIGSYVSSYLMTDVGQRVVMD